MRRVRVEMPLEDFVRLKGRGTFYQSLDSFTLLQVLHAGPGGAASIVQIRPKDPQTTFTQLARRASVRIQLLDQSGGTFTCLMKFGPVSSLYRRLGLRLDSGYIMPPVEVVGGGVRLTFVGSGTEVRRFIAALGKLGLRHRVVALSDYRLSTHSPLNALTEKQRRVLTAAYQHGYYDRPRRISSKTLARRLGLSSSTLVNHRLKAEQRLVSYVLEHDGVGQTPSRN